MLEIDKYIIISILKSNYYNIITMLLQMAYTRHVLLRCVSLDRIMTGVMYT